MSTGWRWGVGVVDLAITVHDDGPRHHWLAPSPPPIQLYEALPGLGATSRPDGDCNTSTAGRGRRLNTCRAACRAGGSGPMSRARSRDRRGHPVRELARSPCLASPPCRRAASPRIDPSAPLPLMLWAAAFVRPAGPPSGLEWWRGFFLSLLLPSPQPPPTSPPQIRAGAGTFSPSSPRRSPPRFRHVPAPPPPPAPLSVDVRGQRRGTPATAGTTHHRRYGAAWI